MQYLQLLGVRVGVQEALKVLSIDIHGFTVFPMFSHVATQDPLLRFSVLLPVRATQLRNWLVLVQQLEEHIYQS